MNKEECANNPISDDCCDFVFQHQANSDNFWRAETHRNKLRLAPKGGWCILKGGEDDTRKNEIAMDKYLFILESH